MIIKSFIDKHKKINGKEIIQREYFNLEIQDFNKYLECVKPSMRADLIALNTI